MPTSGASAKAGSAAMPPLHGEGRASPGGNQRVLAGDGELPQQGTTPVAPAAGRRGRRGSPATSPRRPRPVCAHCPRSRASMQVQRAGARPTANREWRSPAGRNAASPMHAQAERLPQLRPYVSPPPPAAGAPPLPRAEHGPRPARRLQAPAGRAWRRRPRRAGGTGSDNSRASCGTQGSVANRCDR